MAVNLEGGCRVTGRHEGVPAEHGTLRVWPQINRATGAQAISLRLLEFAPGLSPGMRNDRCDEILYVLESVDDSETNVVVEKENDISRKGAKVPRANIFIDGWPFAVSAQTGIYLRPGQTLTVENPGPEPLVLISSQCPDSDSSTSEIVEAVTAPLSATPPPPAIVRLADRRAQPTADRWYRVLIDDEVGSTQVTQFVGSIPPGRAPDHFHNYEEVLFILRGEGRIWAGETSTPIAAGACVYLPKGQTHCVENTGEDELRLLGVFYPAGSPGERYDV
ncbi:MAG: Cupin 2 barrel protein [Acidobacteria bacterium]|nr:Cupin 2 barrel protein [Acidobacteriota bacterium]